MNRRLAEGSMARVFHGFTAYGLVRPLAGAAIVVLGLMLARAAGQADEPLAVTIDRAKVMHISRPADTVIIGNPAIADATIQDKQTLIITGRSFGTTNLIVLDSEGQPIADEVLMVQAADDRVVTIYKRASRETLSCTPDCAPALAIGDQNDSFDAVKKQIEDHQSLTESVGGH
jgi:Flp pilus assembly secretin CpaC